MFTSLENRLWLAVHLLYPNSSQAFDVYQALVLQSEDSLAKDNRIQIFTKLALLFEKIPSVSSNLSFYEFEFDQIDQWKLIYKNSQKPQLLIFVGVLIFDLKISEIAPCARLTKDKAQFLFHQIFKKVSQNGVKAKYNDHLNFKKQNDLKISYLYTYENLVEYCLGQLTEDENEKVKMGIELYPILQTTMAEYKKIISQIQNLKVQRSNSTELKSKNKITLVRDTDSKGAGSEAVPAYKSRKTILGALISVVLLAALGQTSGVFDRIINGEKSVVMRQVVKRPEFAVSQPEIAVESLPKPTETIAPSSQDQTVAAVEPVKKAEPVKVSQVKPVVAEKPEAKSVALKEEGGLFRGTLVVKDLKGSNEKLIAKMVAMGAKKAGEVELGWLKSNNLAYYHFIISDQNIPETKAYLTELGVLKIRFESHPRLIPGGNKRFIIEVKGN